ncbi:MAG: VanZ family protein [Eubacterium sp.]|nr:VanZ family protein [Eubacterium sp.]
MFRNNNRIFYLVLIVIACGIIFSFSATPGSESDSESLYVGRMICNAVVPEYHRMSETEQYNLAFSINYDIRKCAHALEYAVLAMLFFGFWDSFRTSKWRVFMIAGLCTLLYAASDELHQMFVPGRDGKVLDVINDCLGACMGLLVILLITKFKRKKIDEEK